MQVVTSLRRRITFSLTLAVAIGAVASTAWGGEREQVNPFFGTFQTEIQIEAPPFHGLEPRLSLSYASSSGNGLVGVGWSLEGFGAIERAGAKRGAPSYDASDVFLLGGGELVPCAAGSTSPSCTTGGTHSTRIESYQRIAFDAGANTWTVTEKDGTTRTYRAVYTTARGTFRWGLGTVADRSGNTVTYGWWCDPGEDCYPDQISYNGALIRLFREARPDPITFATGGALGTTRYRLRSIDVTVSGARSRAYRLDYGTSGGVTGVSQAPPTTNRFAPEQNWAAYDGINSWSGFFTADVTGDGKDDLVYLDDAYTVNGWRVMPSTGTGFGAPQNWAAYDGILAWAQFWVRDMNGDGKADLLYLDDAYPTNGYRVMLSTGTSFLPPQNWGAYDALNSWSGFWAVDVNGDAKTDLLYLDDAYTVNGWRVMLSTGTSFLPPQNWAAYDGILGWAQTRIADVTGDGRPDIVYLDDAYPVNGYRVMVNRGTSFAPPVNWGAYDALHSWSAWWMADMDGDGKVDMLYLDDAYDANGYHVMLSTGASFAAPVRWGDYDSVAGWAQTWVVDTNGDHKADLLYLDNAYGSTGFRVLASTGAGFASPATWGTYDPIHDWATFKVSDVTGDGLVDLVYLDDAYTVNGYRVKRNLAELATFAASGSSGRSVLVSVTPFGRDAAVDGAGAVTGGTSLPPSRFSTPAATNGFAPEQNWAAYDGINSWSGFFTADVTGDGKDDLVYLDDAYTVNGWRVMPSTGTGFGAPQNWAAYDGILAWAQFWVRDMNGDGKADLLYLDDAYPTNGYRVMLSTGTSFLPPQNWGAYDALNSWSAFWAIDVNGDDKTDLLYLDDAYTVNGWRVMLSTGTGFSAPQNWAAYDGVNGWAQTRIADVTGDGRPDIVYLDDAYPVNGWRVMVNRGTSFAPPVNWGAYDALNSWSAWWMADMNGDGKVDMLYLDDAYDANGYRVMLSTGASFAAPVSWGPYDSVNGWAQTWVVDANGDGRQDLLYLDNNYTINGFRVMLGSAEGFAPPQNWGSYDPIHDWQTFRIADATGDGLVDLVYLDDAYTVNGYRVKANQTSRDLVTLVDNGLGGTTAIGYQPSTRWSNTFMPTGLVAQTVATLTATDGRGTSATTSYTYQGGLWSSTERSFLGFRKVTTVVDAAGSYTETYYHQHVGCIAKPEVTYFRAGAGQIYSYTSYVYAENAAPPYTSLMTERWEYECNLDASCRRVVAQIGYDQYGNALTTKEWGDYDVAGDEVTTVRGYYPNPTTFVVTKPAYENVYAGIGTGGALLKQTLHYYDGATSYTTAPAAAGNVTRQDRWDSRTGGYATRRYGYDAWGNLTADTDELGRTQTFAYDGTYHVFRTRRCDALGRCTSATYDSTLAAPLTEVDASGGVRVVTYDALGRVATETNPGSGTMTWQYLAWGDPQQQRIRQILPDGSGDGLWTEAYLDGAMRKYKWAREGGAQREVVYSAMTTRVWKASAWYAPATEPARWQIHAYDGAGRMVRTTNPDGTFAEVSYGDGYARKTNEVGDVTFEYVDGAGRLIKVVEQDGAVARTTLTQRDAVGRVIGRTDAVGRTSSNQWDSLDRQTRACDPDTGCWSYTHDAAGLVATVTDAKGQTFAIARDAVGRPIRKNLPDGTFVAWTYDEAGHGKSLGGDQPTSVTWPSGTDHLTYDAAGRVVVSTRCVTGACQTQRWSYDALGRQIDTTYPTGEVVRWTYDSAGRLASVPGYVTSMTWNARDQLTSMTYANGVVQTYGYTAERAALASSVVTKGATRLYDASYAYDGAGRVASSSSTTDALFNNSYTYDRLGRLTGVAGAQPESFTYDPTGNITSSAAVGAYQYTDAAHAHAVTRAGTDTFTYDGNGNQLTGGGRTLTWDSENRLVAVSTGTATASYAYDAEGQRVARDGTAGLTRFYGKQFEVQPGGHTVAHIYAGPMPVARVSNLTGTTFLHQDRLGSIQLITTAAGVPSRQLDYSVFGRTTATSGSGASERGFQGHETEADVGLIYMNARYYDARLGRFLSPDSVIPDPRNPAALNRYAFGYNNPICNTDPTGHVPVVAALITAVTVNSTVAWIGLAFTAVGYITKDPLLMTIGGVMTGFAAGAAGTLLGGGMAGGILGASVAALTSPLSPLDPKVKSALGWAYGIASFASAQMKASVEIENKIAAGRKLVSDGGAEDLLAKFENPDSAAATLYEISSKGVVDASGSPMSVRSILDKIIANNDLKAGMLGPSQAGSVMGAILDKTVGWIPSVRLHGIVHDGYGFAFIDFGTGPGFGGAGGSAGAWLTGFLGGGNMLKGQVEGLYRWGSLDMFGGAKTDGTNRRFGR
ncbi:MAG: VCBS repeat-containing protein [Myxococcales bacterium]|nr:VCBS repeat-containing protein [Myxococcales bacterium]